MKIKLRTRWKARDGTLLLDKDKDFSKNDKIIAILLSESPQFISLIQSLRASFDLSVMGTKRKDLSRDDIAILNGKIRQLTRNLHLHDNWGISIEALVYSNVLYIPPKFGFDAIGLIHDDVINYCLDEDKFKLRSSYVHYLQSIIRELTKYPRIEIREKIPVDQLRDWIKSNSKQISRSTSNLIRPVSFRTEINTIFWGHIAWLWNQSHGSTQHKWKKLEKKIGQLIIDKELIVADQMNAPTSKYLRNAYIAFDRAISKTEI